MGLTCTYAFVPNNETNKYQLGKSIEKIQPSYISLEMEQKTRGDLNGQRRAQPLAATAPTLLATPSQQPATTAKAFLAMEKVLYIDLNNEQYLL
jgi:hypothetical protein